MERKKFYKISIVLLIIIFWGLLISGIFRIPVFGWLILTMITFIFYLVITGYTFQRRGSLKNVVNDMENHMERKAEERLGKDEEEKDSEKEEYDFGDDIEIIKK